MDLSRLSLATKLITGAAIVFLIVTFLQWQQVCVSFANVSGCSGVSGWHGTVGVLLGILIILLIAWELVKIVGVELPELPVADRQIELGLIVGVVAFTILAFITKNEARHWWVQILGVICGAVIAYGGWRRMQGDEDGAPASSTAAAVDDTPAPAATPAYTPPPAAEPTPPPAAPAPPADEPPAAPPSGDPL